MNWNRRLRMGRTPAMGAAIVSGLVGAALLVGPMTGAQAAKYPEDYYNGGFCYQNSSGHKNMFRLQFSEVSYSPNDPAAHFSWQLQRWDEDSLEYYNDEDPMQTRGVSKDKLDVNSDMDANMFCKLMTGSLPLKPKVKYPHGRWTSWHKRTSSPSSSPESSPKSSPTPSPKS